MKKNISAEFSKKTARELDRKDPLKAFKREFLFPRVGRKPALYFCGNSLGLEPKGTRRYLLEELGEWSRLGVEGHFHAQRPWLPYHEFVTESLARLVGARPIEVVAMNSLSVNIHLLFTTFYLPAGSRSKILIESQAFPSDQYAVASQASLRGLDPREAMIEGGSDTASIVRAIETHGPELAVVWLGQPNYLSGHAFDVRAIARAAHRVGAVLGLDLAHGIGNLELALHDWDVDFATWCSYKYLNSGAGGISGVFIHERHATRTDLPRFQGWWGHRKDTRFKMGPQFEAIPTAEGWQLSNPPIFQLAALRASLDLFDRARIGRLRKKSVSLTAFLELGLQTRLPEVEIFTPKDPERRGAQLSLRIPGAPKALVSKLLKQGVMADFREPDIVRLAPAPLYTSFEDVYRLVEILEDVLGAGS